MAMRTVLAVTLAALSVGAAACSGAPADDGATQHEDSLRPIPRPAPGCRGVEYAEVRGIVVEQRDSRAACPRIVVRGFVLSGVSSTQFIADATAEDWHWVGISDEHQPYATMFGPFWPDAAARGAPYCVYEFNGLVEGQNVMIGLNRVPIADDEAAARLTFGDAFVGVTELCEPMVISPASHPCSNCGTTN
jgi:hypothetical protein